MVKHMMNEYGFILASKYRTKIIKSLSESPKIPSQIGRETGIRTHHISATLKPLKEHGIVECVNPEAKKGRLYRLTDLGEELSKKLD